MAIQDLLQSSLFIILIGVGIPIAAFLEILFRVILPKTKRVQTQQSPQNISQEQRFPTQQKPANDETSKYSSDSIEKALKDVLGKMDKKENELLTNITNSFNEMKKLIENLNSAVEELALSVKASESDSSSPFNTIIQQEEEHVSREISTVSQLVGSNNPNNVNLTWFIKSCVLLEIMEYDEEKIKQLYELGYVSSDDMFTILRILSFIKNRKITAKELASIAANIAESYSSLTPEIKKYIMILEGGGVNG
ncbi:hypothetical protein [Sulfolobus acidocaldarius]|uniref:Archaeal flagellar motor scaffold protein FlaX n=4 Tax=Sulfolobus acidocaldarius TaxID=2285 RepID=FLAX_SULAC|nr:hypothetical protein [Sulfolobus acidocaldarius]AAY80524.1 conserved protein [Sulfolobus acidocaldarius DSM 639]AGE71113.1 hypothetical protein SacN8_05740 [Sulfolobus acidocaldarius N8]AGE73383.1 hypothetical protein SacRon12I_05735 [Sulfolobus acidocaldarius Ron12/I]ALU28611.1 hypothetical protein ATY89_00605 [Sulfolobus acidocaldarius]ALU31326.1 hypothetical protein ATZ20_03650 [Sulfolobus acidocaldarius]